MSMRPYDKAGEVYLGLDLDNEEGMRRLKQLQEWGRSYAMNVLATTGLGLKQEVKDKINNKIEHMV